MHVLPHVLLQPPTVREPVVADGALERLLLGVSLEVSLHLGLLCKRPGAQRACVRAFARVGAAVARQVAVLPEAPGAVLAGVGLLTRVRAAVGLHVVLLQGRVATDVAPEAHAQTSPQDGALAVAGPNLTVADGATPNQQHC